jgi:hypothetical protein
MGTTISSVFNPEILTDTVQGAFGQATAFMGSRMASLGIAIVNGEMPEGGPDAIGTTVKVPYFGTIGEFASNPDGSSLTPATLKQGYESGTVARYSLGFEVSRWASGNAALMPGNPDPYEEAARQIMVAAERSMDSQLITVASASGVYTKDVYSSTVPRYLDYDLCVDAKFQGWGDEQDDIGAILVHSQAHKDLMKLKSAVGTPLLVSSQKEGGPLDTFCGFPVVVSDRVPVTGSAMGAVTSSGTSPPVLALAGTPLGAFNLSIDCVVGGANATGTIRFSTDGGNTWSATMVTLGAGVAQPLIDTATDSTVGVNGATGLTASFASGTFNADNLYTSTASMKVVSMLLKKRALAFWYNRRALELQTDKNIRSDSREAAMHLYGVPYRYKRLGLGSTKSGVVQIVHNVSGF